MASLTCSRDERVSLLDRLMIMKMRYLFFVVLVGAIFAAAVKRHADERAESDPRSLFAQSSAGFVGARSANLQFKLNGDSLPKSEMQLVTALDSQPE